MNKIVQKVAAATMKIRKGPTGQRGGNAEKDDKKDKSNQPKSVEKKQKKALFKIRHKKATEEYSSSSTKTQASMLDESLVIKEMEKLKSDLKDESKRDQANKWIDSLLDKGVAGLEMEMEKLNKIAEKVESKGFDANMERNFSKAVTCQDKGRVLLKHTTNSYIHANYISTPKFPKHFICTQRPMQTTTESFYKMIIQEGVQCVVMLCSFSETTEKSSPPYFPQTFTEKPMKFGSITIKCTNTEGMKEEKDVVITTLVITEGGKAKLIKHYHWKNWPERGFPDPTLAIFNLLCAIRGFKKPIIVHCSDGVGRSGVFVAMECILQKLQRGENCNDLIEVVKEVRNQRAMAIRTAGEYILLNRLLLQLFHDLNLVDMSQRLLEFIDDYDAYARKHKDGK